MARDPARVQRITDKLATLWEQNSDQRFFQLLTNLHLFDHVTEDGLVVGIKDPYNDEDDKLEAALDDVLAHGFQARDSAAPNG